MRNPTTTPLHKHHQHSYPWVIWVEEVRGNLLILTVLRPKHRLFRPPKPVVDDYLPPVLYENEADKLDLTMQLIDAGKERIPRGVRFLSALDFPDVIGILHEIWGIPLEDVGKQVRKPTAHPSTLGGITD